MHRCTSSHGHGNSYTPCSSCGFYQAPSNSFSMLFPQQQYDQYDHQVADHVYPYTSPSSSVDCTLSLGTPSTRQTSYNRESSSTTSGGGGGSKKISWDFFQTKKKTCSSQKSNHGANNGNNHLSGDSLLARRCANCDTTSTPLWRNGPRGPKSLCNACGIRYKKEERRAATSTTSSTTATTMTDPRHYMSHHHMNPWTHQGNEFMFIQDNDGDSTDTPIPFLSWRLNVPSDRTSLVHDYS